MTKATDIANIVKPLDWDEYDEANGYGGTYKIGQMEFNSGYYYLINDYLVGMDFKTKIDAKTSANREHIDCVKQFIDPTKLQPQPEPFWKPIEQCPREGGVFYFCRHEGGEIHISEFISGCHPLGGTYGYWQSTCGYSDQDECYTHFAEIPPYEVQP